MFRTSRNSLLSGIEQIGGGVVSPSYSISSSPRASISVPSSSVNT
jgi:hypothetical protein